MRLPVLALRPRPRAAGCATPAVAMPRQQGLCVTQSFHHEHGCMTERAGMCTMQCAPALPPEVAARARRTRAATSRARVSKRRTPARTKKRHGLTTRRQPTNSGTCNLTRSATPRTGCGRNRGRQCEASAGAVGPQEHATGAPPGGRRTWLRTQSHIPNPTTKSEVCRIGSCGD